MTEQQASKWICHYEPSLWKGDGDIYLGIRRTDDTTDLIISMDLKRIEPHERAAKATLEAGNPVLPQGNKGFMQAVLDEAWRHGMRPTGHDSSLTEFEALSRHLDDMRAIAFEQLNIKRG